MTRDVIVNLFAYLDPILCGLVLAVLLRSTAARKYAALVALLSVRLTSSAICIPLLYFCARGIERHAAYQAYFYVYWVSYAIEAVLSLLVIYSIFRLAMEPLKGLQTLGMLVFRWAAAISIALAVGMAMSPQVSGVQLMTVMVTQLQQTTSVLTLCLLLFVCFAISPMGLTYRSRIFGVSLGLGIMAATSLVDAAWMSHSKEMFSTINILNGVVGCVTLLCWSAYFAFPEQKRRIIVLPTTSPFLRWNQISMALGDDPGYVAIGGIPPDVFAPAELEVMRRASAKMNASTSATHSALSAGHPTLQSQLLSSTENSPLLGV